MESHVLTESLNKKYRFGIAKSEKREALFKNGPQLNLD